ncbi:oxidoreductase [[Actinomadura] parvosata]|uniref:oxidoreductase n=1 Tax=[Actinomadura] parvosata TaxID=1955412 RepID=UPI00406BFB51
MTMSSTALTSRLFEPARLGPLHLPNRLVMAPLTRNRASADGVPTPLMATYYAQRASAGLIIADAIGPERVGLRIAPGVTANAMREHDVERVYPELVGALAGKGLAYLHVVFADPAQPLFHRLRRAWPAVLIANPALPWPTPFPADGGRQEGERLLAAGADLVSLGRAFLANPDLVERFRRGAPLNPVRPEYWYGGGELGYTDYPVLGRHPVAV